MTVSAKQGAWAWRYILAALLLLPSWAGAADRTALGNTDAFYPRAIRLSHQTDPAKNGMIVVAATAFAGGPGHEDIFTSLDGRAFAKAGSVSDAIFSKGLCCGTLFELPTAIGAMPAGTLLWAGSVGGDTPGSPMEIRIYQSTDQGTSWSYKSNCATGTVPRSAGGLWEPEFAIARNGQLVCYYSDETEAGHSQLLNEVSSSDGITWTGKTHVIASSVAADRPGMMVVSELPNGSFFMTHELCGPASCTVFYKTSADGLSWGSATDVGKRVETANGQYFLHTPTNAWAPVAGTANGKIVVIGQILAQSDGRAAPTNGAAIMINSTADGSGPWQLLPAPVMIAAPLTPQSAYNVCQNYSSPLLPSVDGLSVLSVATDLVSGSCRAFFATGPLNGFGVAATNVSITGTTSGSSTISLTSIGGYHGNVVLTASIPSLAADLSFAPATAALAADGTAAATLTIKPSAAAMLGALPGSGPTMLAGLFLPVAFVSRRRRVLGRTLFGIGLAATLANCGGGGSTSTGGGSTGGSGSTPVTTTYTGTVTAKDAVDGSIVATAPISVSVTR